MIEIKFGQDSITPALHRLALAGQRLSPLMRELAGIMLHAVEDNFEQSGRPAWADLKTGSWLSRAGALTKKGQVSKARFEKRVRGAKILVASARLKNSITPFSDARQALVGTNVKYAAIHQFGGITKPHVIRPRGKKALAWATGGHPVKSVNHPGSNIPARPFLRLSTEDENKILRRVESYLTALVEK